MSVVPLTLTISLCLVFTFVVFFLREHARGQISCAERDSLLPLADETPRLARVLAQQDMVPADCGCGDDNRPICPVCLRRC
jgi:hypothetical protein